MTVRITIQLNKDIMKKIGRIAMNENKTIDDVVRELEEEAKEYLLRKIDEKLSAVAVAGDNI